MEVRLELEAKDLELREKLNALAVAGLISPKDFQSAFVEEIVVRIKPDGRTLNRLDKLGGKVTEAIRAYRSR